MMVKKHNQLIDFLSNQGGEYISALKIAEALGVTDRTIRNYIKEINEKENHITIVSSAEGYKLESLNQSLIPVDNHTFEENLLDFEIIQFLMEQEDYTTYDDIADKFFYSTQTIRSRIQKLTTNMEKLGIDASIDTKVFKGIKLVGTEVQKRLLLENLFTAISLKKEVFKDFVINSFNTWLDRSSIEETLNLVEEINIKYDLNLEFLMYKKISTQLIIMIYRLHHDNHIFTEADEENIFDNFKEYEIADDLCDGIRKDMNIMKTDVIFLTNYLMSLHLDLEENESEHRDERTVQKIERILKGIEDIYHVPTYSEGKFRSNILNHIYRIIYPVSHNFLTYNPFVKETKSEYFFSFSIASNIAMELEKDFAVEMHDSEIAYLAYHIQNIFEAQSKRMIKTIVLYNRNVERTKLIASKIATYFNELEICRIEKYSKALKFEDRYLYVGIDLTGSVEPRKNLILINNGLQKNEIKEIRFLLESRHSIMEGAHIFWIDKENPEDVINDLLERSDRKKFIQPVMKREEMSSTSIGNLVALPHPYFGNKEYKEEVIIGINNEPIQWGSEMVQLIIIYLPSSDVERNEYVFAEFFQKTKNLKNVMALVKTTSQKDFINCWNQI